jgi:peroxiredoxin
VQIRTIALDFFAPAPIEAIGREWPKGAGLHRFDRTLDRDLAVCQQGRGGAAPALEETPVTEAKSLEQALTEAFEQADHLDAPLEQRLELYLGESRRLLPDLETTYDQLVKRIAANGADELVPAIGEVLPNFLMTDSKGHLVDLAALLAKGPLVVSFNRGPWCDYCGLELHALARAYPGIVAAGGEVVSIVPETEHYARRLQEVRGLPFTVLTDLDLAYALSLGLVFWVGDKIKEMYGQFGIDLAQFQGNGGWLLPIPATLVVGQDGRVKARFVDPDFRHRMDIEDIFKALA